MLTDLHVGDETPGRPVLGCIPEMEAKTTVQEALRRHASIEWIGTFDALKARVQQTHRSLTVVVTESDGAGGSADELAEALRVSSAALVVWCRSPDPVLLPALARAGVQDVMIGDLADQSPIIRSVVLGAATGAAADLVMVEIGGAIPEPLIGFVEMAVRRPRTMQRVADVAAALNLPRQTIGRWCRDRRYLKPEELLHWSRMFLVAALLDSTGWSAEQTAQAMSYASGTALRNRIRAYTGLTPTDLKRRGIAAVRAAFERRLSGVGRGTGELGDAPPAVQPALSTEH